MTSKQIRFLLDEKLDAQMEVASSCKGDLNASREAPRLDERQCSLRDQPSDVSSKYLSRHKPNFTSDPCDWTH